MNLDDAQIDIAISLADTFEIAITVAKSLEQAVEYARTAVADVREQHPEVSNESLVLALGWALGRYEMRRRLASGAG